ncbi:hypothetical protein IJJ08_04035 [bacterium]|nr:hypothetical protein [bacterium]
MLNTINQSINSFDPLLLRCVLSQESEQLERARMLLEYDDHDLATMLRQAISTVYPQLENRERDHDYNPHSPCPQNVEQLKAAINLGLADYEAGRVCDASDVRAELRAKFPDLWPTK